MTIYQKRLKEIFLILLGTCAVYFLIALLSYNPEDPGWSYISSNKINSNSAGIIGAYCADLGFYLLGILAFAIPLGSLYGLYISYKDNIFTDEFNAIPMALTIFGFILLIISGAGLAELFINTNLKLPSGQGGLIGKLLVNFLIPNFEKTGTALFLTAISLVGIILFTGASVIYNFNLVFKNFLEYLKLALPKVYLYFKKYLKILSLSLYNATINFLGKYLSIKNYKKYKESKKDSISNTRLEAPFKTINSKNTVNNSEHYIDNNIKDSKAKTSKIEVPKSILPTPTQNLNNNSPIKPSSNINTHDTKDILNLPSISLLDIPNLSDRTGYTNQQLEEIAALVETKLLEFGLKVEVVAVSPGPVIVRLELMLAPGTKVSRLTTISKDIARSLAIESVRVVEVIPGKPYVGLEIPNQHREVVFLSEVLESYEYKNSKSPITLILGKDIAGQTMVADLSKMPHLLVAGTTGSGKSVGINAMILSILFRSTPDEVRIIMIDPKMLELAIYEGIPHLLTPVVTDMKDAANVLRWCVAEMEQRYRLMAAMGVRNIIGYNQKIDKAIKKGEPLIDPLWPDEALDPPPELEKLPYIVVIIDEFADMIMVVGKKVEELIARIAQKARAAGIHMILATQRPSVDVITGLIKANIPTRVAFQVSSKIDSRTILDQQGAETLLGQGDMLFLPPGTGIPTRVHGAFVADHEVHSVVNSIRKNGEPNYVPDILNKVNVPGLGKFDFEGEEDAELDALYDEAIQFILETKKTSISALQRRFKIGYNRAARIIEHMEEVGVLSPMQSNGLREILVTNGVG